MTSKNPRPNSSTPNNTSSTDAVFESDELPSEGRLAAIDLGTVRVGIAVCDPSQTWTSPYETWNRQPGKEEKYFRELIHKERLVGFVVGLPLHNDGKESRISAAAREFAAWLKVTFQLPVTLFDERFSSAQASALLDQMELTQKKRKERLDQLAAHIILEAYLESSRQPKTPPLAIDDRQNN
jgi:putative holliday junction resolvase